VGVLGLYLENDAVDLLGVVEVLQLLG